MFNSVVSFDSALSQEQGRCRLFRFSLTALQVFSGDSSCTLIVAGSFDLTASQALDDAGCFDSTASQALRFLYDLD